MAPKVGLVDTSLFPILLALVGVQTFMAPAPDATLSPLLNGEIGVTLFRHLALAANLDGRMNMACPPDAVRFCYSF